MVVLKDISFRTHLGNFFIFRSICCDDLQAETTQEDEDLSLAVCDDTKRMQSVWSTDVAAWEASFVGANSLT